ncbi:MAG: WS/DGAT domain-containing protein [Myxococcota bacterium]
MIFARIPSGERSPSRVYARVSGALAQAKVSHMAEALEAVMTLAGWSPQRLTRALTRRALALHVANLVVTNVRGPSAPLYLLDAPLERTWPIVPLMPGQTLAVAVMSYAGRLHWGSMRIAPACATSTTGRSWPSAPSSGCMRRRPEADAMAARNDAALD